MTGVFSCAVYWYFKTMKTQLNEKFDVKLDGWDIFSFPVSSFRLLLKFKSMDLKTDFKVTFKLPKTKFMKFFDIKVECKIWFTTEAENHWNLSKTILLPMYANFNPD